MIKIDIKPLSVNKCKKCKKIISGMGKTGLCQSCVRIGMKVGKYNIKAINKGWFRNQDKEKEAKCFICKKYFKYYPLTREKKYCSIECYRISQRGRKRPRQSILMTGRTSPMKGKSISKELREKLSGSNSSRWRGGITPLYHKIRRLPEYKKWRVGVFNRDQFICVKCNIPNLRLEADHIKPFFIIIMENEITNYIDAINCKELWDITNGRTLCKPCHKETDTYGKNQYSSSFGK